MIQIEELLRNNNQPSDTAAQEVRDLLLQPTKELNNLDAEIRHIEEHLEELKIKRKQVQETIKRYSVILSPIRRIPTDILHEIFHHCLPLNRNSIMLEIEAPVFSDQDLLMDSDEDEPLLIRPWTESVSRLPKSRVSQILWRRCEAVDEWLRRSGTCPLSISISYTSSLYGNSPWNSTYDPGSSATTTQLFKILRCFSDRWLDIDITMPFEVYSIFESHFINSDLEMLTAWQVSFYNQHGPQIGTIGILKAPNLQKIALNLNNSDIIANWKKLTDISLHTSLSVAETVKLLKSCPELINLRLTLSTRSNNDFNAALGPEPLFVDSPISLPHLRTLHIVENFRSNYIGNFYDRIDAAELRWVVFRKLSSYSDDNGVSIPIIGLLHRLTKLKKLSIDTSNEFTTEDLCQIFRSASNITHLVIGPETRMETGSLVRDWTYLAGNSRTSWSFNDLFVDGGTALEATDMPLLPHLEILEMSGTAVSVSDKTLLKFIISRTNPLISNVFTELKHVGIIFNRPEKQSIAEGVRQHAQFLGVTSKIKLDLDYTSASPSHRQPTYAGYGLVDISEGRS